ncbi:Sporulation-specific protein 2 [Spathaspora sp. JA1]|nr:Sporulation-specific protein 2 [Spathaspora sp. JA1]
MLKSMIQTDSLMNESPRTNTTTTLFPKRSSLVSNISSSLRLPSFAVRAGLVSEEQRYGNSSSTTSRRNNFLKVCSWAFSKLESETTNNFQVNQYDSDEEDDKNFNTITPKRRHRYKPLIGINPSVENINSNSNQHSNNSEKLMKTLSRITQRKPEPIVNRKRIVVLTNIDATMGINSILQQVCGGPLEKVIQLNNGHVELYFIFPEHAIQFYTYGKATGLLMVNGQRLRVEWWMNENENENENYHPTISKQLLSDIIQFKCRRCLVLTKEVTGKSCRTGSDKLFYPDPKIHYSQDLNIEQVRNDFGKYGIILDIGSVISRKLCFSIFYSNIRSAIYAKKEMELEGSELNEKYKGWDIGYGTDITDRSIPFDWDEETVKSVVCGSGNIVDVRLGFDYAGKNKGYCFIEYQTVSDAQRALPLLSQIVLMGGKRLRVEASKEGLKGDKQRGEVKPVLQLTRSKLPDYVKMPNELLVGPGVSGGIGGGRINSPRPNIPNIPMNRMTPTTTTTTSGGGQMPMKYTNATKNFPQPVALPFAIPDKINETLSKIPPVQLIELIATMKNSNGAGPIHEILQVSPDLAACAAQALLLMGFIDGDVISDSMKSASSTPQPQPQQHTPQLQSTPQPPPFINQPTFHAPPAPMANPYGVPFSGNPGNNSNAQPWLSHETQAKLAGLPPDQKELVIQILSLPPDQVRSLPIDKQEMVKNLHAKMDPPEFLSTVIDFDINPISTSDILPTWLRDVLERALGASGLTADTTVKSASDEAISSLVKLDYSIIRDSECPICFESYKEGIKQAEKVDNPRDNYVHDLNTYNMLLSNDCDLVQKLGEVGVFIESKQESAKFNDPGLFFPTDLGGSHYSRFPQRNLSTLKIVREEDQFPGYKDKQQTEEEKEKRIKEFKREGHIAVKMPECGHIFGLSCIVEWLKSNVSCPLCRKEVEAKINDPKADSISTIKTLHNFNSEESVSDHINNHSTDVFNPYRRPYNPAVTPITDSHLPQNWVTPYTQTKVNVTDPDLVLPRKFPFFESQVHAVPIRRRTSFRTQRRRQPQQPQQRTPQQNETNQRSPQTNERRVNFSPHTTNIGDLNDSDISTGVLHDSSDSYPEQELPTQEQPRNPLSFIQRIQSRLSRTPSGGPDRGRLARERRHPYLRPPEEDSN